MILIWLISVSLMTSLLSIIPKKSASWGAKITLLGSFLTLLLAILTVFNIINSSSHILIAIPNWIALDAMGAVILLLISFIYFTASLFSMGYMNFKEKKEKQKYFLNFNLFAFSMLILPLIQEPNTVWIAVELTTLFSVLLVGFQNTHAAIEAAWKYIVLTIMGAAIALLGFLILYWAARQAGIEHYTWQGLQEIAPQMSPVLLRASFIFIFVGFGAKIGLVPLHTWLPDAHSQAPSPVCAMLSGIETTAILYIILRLLPIITASNSIDVNDWLMIFGLISVGVASFLILQVKDYKRLFAFSTVEQMGIILVAFGLGGHDANLAATTQIIAHAVTKSFCFYAAGGVLMFAGTRDIASVKNLIQRSPLVGIAFLFGGLSIAGAPPFALFLSEFSILKAGLEKGEYLIIGLLVTFIAIAFFAIMYHVSGMVFGDNEAKNENKSSFSLPLSSKITFMVASLPIILFGIYIPQTLQKLIELAASTIGG